MASTKSCRLVAYALTAAALSCSGVSAEEAERTEDITAQIVSLQKERVETLKQALEYVTVMYQQGKAEFKATGEAQLDLLEAHLRGPIRQRSK